MATDIVVVVAAAQRVTVANWIIVITVEAVAGATVQRGSGTRQARRSQRTAFHGTRPRLHGPGYTLVYPANGPKRCRSEWLTMLVECNSNGYGEWLANKLIFIPIMIILFLYRTLSMAHPFCVGGSVGPVTVTLQIE